MIDEEIGMPAKRELSMRQLRHLLRLHHDGASAREIGRRLGVARSPIQHNLKRAPAAGLAWPLADGVTDEALERQLFGRAGVTQGQRRRVGPDWAALARELKRHGVTMTILWEEYREAHPCRRDPRPRHSQRLPHRSGRRELAQAAILVMKSTRARRLARSTLRATK